MIIVKFDCIDRRLRKLFYRYGNFVSRHPWPILSIPVIFTIVFGLGFLINVAEINDFTYLHTPLDAPSLDERRKLLQNWQLSQNTKRFSPGKTTNGDGLCQIIVTAKDGTDVLRPLHIQSLINLNDYVINRLLISDDNGNQIGYKDLCMKFAEECYANSNDLLGAALISLKPATDDDSTLTYPWMSYGERNFYMADVLGGVITDSHSRINSAQAWLLSYQLKTKINSTEYSWQSSWRSAFVDAVVNYDNSYLHTAAYHSESLNNEMNGFTDQLTPIFIICGISLVISLTIFGLASVNAGWIDWSISKPWVAVSGAVAMCMALISAFGFLRLIKISFNDIVLITPFLIAPIVCQHVFVVLNAFRLSEISDKRLGYCLKQCGPSLLITMIMDVSSLAVAGFMSTPAIHLFCIYACFSIVFTFLWLQTWFISILSLSVPLENRGKHSLCCWINAVEMTDEMNYCTRVLIARYRRNTTDDDETQIGPFNKFFGTKFVSFLNHKVTKIFVVLLLISYLCVTAYYTTFYSIGVDTQKLLPDDSYAIDFLKLREKYFWSSGVLMQIVISKPPDLSREEERQKIYNLLNDFVNSNVTTGVNGVEFWFNEFAEFSPSVFRSNISSEEFYLAIDNNFLKNSSFQYFQDDITWGNINLAQNPAMIVAFRFFVGLKRFSNINDQMLTVATVRHIASKYPDYDVSTFASQWLSVDQMIMAPWNAFVTICCQFGAFLLIAFLFVPHPAVTLLCLLSAIFVEFGVIAISILFGITLNSISTLALVSLTILSTHFSFHIGYGYCSFSSASSFERLKHCATLIIWPSVECVLSTVITLSVLWTYDFYVLTTFLLSLTLAMVISLAVSVVFLPVLLTTFVGKAFCFGASSRREISGIRAIDDNIVVRGHRDEENGTKFEGHSLPLYPNVKLPRVSSRRNDKLERLMSSTWPIVEPSGDDISTHKRFLEPLPDDLYMSPKAPEPRNLSTHAMGRLSSVASVEIPTDDEYPNEVFVDANDDPHEGSKLPKVSQSEPKNDHFSSQSEPKNAQKFFSQSESKSDNCLDYVDVETVLVPNIIPRAKILSPNKRSSILSSSNNERNKVCFENELY